MPNPKRPHVVIIGAGFGGLAAAKGLERADVDITVIDKRNHHLFQPLLYQVATAGLSPADIASPIRHILRKQANISVLLDRVYGIDREKKYVILGEHDPLAYDWLIIATGARHSYFGNDAWEPFARGIKTIEDATQVRRNILMALERAETEPDPERRAALLTFVIIGGGPTGVEMAGAIAELARKSVSSDFRNIGAHSSRIILLQRGDRLLPSFPEKLSAKTLTAIQKLGAEVQLKANVTDIDADGVTANNVKIPSKTVIWAAGVTASRASEWLDCGRDTAGRVQVSTRLHPMNDPAIFVIGDTAACTDGNGLMLPGVAPVAKQQGEYAAKAIMAHLRGRKAEPFCYKNYGNLATIGRSQAVADFGRFQLSGFAGWVLWCTAHIWFLSGFRNRIGVGITWLWSYITFERNARLITGDFAPDLPATRELAAHLKQRPTVEA